MKKKVVTAALLLLATGTGWTAEGASWTASVKASAQAAEQARFTDIAGHWAEGTINRLSEKGILDGFPDGSFRPDEPVKIDQFVKMLLLSYSQLHPNGERSWKTDFVQALSPANQGILKQDYRSFSFKPSDVGYWAKPFLDLASDLNFLNKSRYTDFKADLKRENVAEILYYTLSEIEYLEDDKYSMSLTVSIGDLQSASSREQRFIGEVYAKGIMEGYPNGYFGVGKTVTRAESLTLLERMTVKEKRLTPKESDTANGLIQRVPTKDGSYKAVVFPSSKMAEAYGIMQEAAKLRGTNYDLVETAARLYKDREEKAKALTGGGTAGAAAGYEEAALWLEPEYKTYGVTIRAEEGVLARNEESVRQYADFVFGYRAELFHQAFREAFAKALEGQKVEAQTWTIGTYSVELHTEGDGRTLVFSIMEKE